MPTSAVEADIISFNTTISACEKGCQWEMALQVVSDMQAVEILPDAVSFSAAISACEKASQWEMALELFSQMPASRITKDARQMYLTHLKRCDGVLCEM